LLREDGVGANFIAKLVLAVMMGDEAVKELIGPRPTFAPTDQCLECTMRVMNDRKPLMTVEAYQQSVEDGRRSSRRRRRQQRHAERMLSNRPRTAASASFTGLRSPPRP
jgi:hypothetical protein